MSILNRMRIILVYNAILRRRFSDVKKFSFNEINREMNRRIRDRKLERILQAERDMNENDEAKTSEETDLTNQLDSVVVSSYLSRNLDKFAEIYPDVVEEIKRKKSMNSPLIPSKTDEKLQASSIPQYPYRKITDVTLDSSKKNSENAEKFDGVTPDRGFFVYRDDFKDEYVAGSASVLPQDKEFSLINNNFKLKPGAPVTFRKRFGPIDAVEEIEFQLPHQQIKRNISSEHNFEDDWSLRYGVADPKIEPADKNCPACGAQFHCQNSSLPGFLPAEYFLDCIEKKFHETICRRCYLLKTHDFLVNVNVSDVNYVEMLNKLKKIHEALIILIVDMLDFPCSIYKNLPDLIGEGKHVILVGNKIDLIPPDLMNDYLSHYKFCLRKSIKDLGFDKKLNIVKTFLISAKTGYNIEELVTYIQVHWGSKGDIYLVGCTNSGKSTLFNAFLQSDLCKIRAVDLVERATTSIWPGTTMSLLKFPVMNPTPHKLKARERRFMFLKQEVDEEDLHREHLLRETGNPEYAVLQGNIGRTFEFEEEIDVNQPTSSLHMLPEQLPKKKKSNVDLNHTIFTAGKWCYDTPGTINYDQIINILTLEELTKTIPGSLIMPRTILLRRFQTLLVGGLARVDYLGPVGQVFLTVFASERLPLNITERLETTKFFDKFYGSGVLGVPCGGEERLRDFPLLESKDFRLKGIGMEESCGDIILSSVGWVGVTAATNRNADFRVWTPGRRGMHVREPSLLPFAVQRKGRRIEGTNEYEVKPLFSKSRNWSG